MHFSAALLAGGRSSRMGRNKAFLEIDGVPLWQRQIRTLQELNPSELFLAGPARSEWIKAGLEVVPDAVSDAGPLAGLVAVLRRCKTAQLLALAVDLPNMSSRYLERLLSCCEPGNGVIPKSEERFEPLAAVYPAACLPLAESLLEAKHHSLQELAVCALEQGLVTARMIAEDDQPLFFNLNTPEDFGPLPRISLTQEHA
jgi:molybdenum cofactor guanylyltransferase